MTDKDDKSDGRNDAATRNDAAAPDTSVVGIEAAVLRRLLAHLDKRSDVQNIDLMILAGFCRNCLSRWMVEEATARGLDIDMARAREAVYGMPYASWKQKFQTKATPGQIEAFEALDDDATS